MKNKKYIVIILFSIFIYFLLSFIYNNFVLKNNYKEAYVLSEDVKKGEKIDFNKLEKIKYDSSVNLGEFSKTNDMDLYVYNNGYLRGEILTNDMIFLNEEYLSVEEDKEMVAIRINDVQDNLCGNIKKGDNINIYVSAMTSKLNKFINADNVESFCSQSENEVSTIKFLSQVKVLNCYNSEGNVIKDKEMIDSILIEVNKEVAIRINNLKEYATFSITKNY